MVNFLNRRSLTLISLLYTGFVILNWFGPADAALLKDIRVGEYDNFTRIVFELDGRSANPDIETRPSGQLLVTFNNAGVDLVRKIPVERSPHIKDIQIWQRKEGLSALLISNYSNIRIESFRLSRPPRFAVDIFPISEPAKENMAAPSAPLTSASEEVTPSPEKNNQFDSTAEKRAQSPAHGQAPTRNVESSPPEDKTLSPDEVDRNSPPPLTVENIQHPTPDKPTLDTEDASGTEKSFAPPAETDSSITKQQRSQPYPNRHLNRGSKHLLKLIEATSLRLPWREINPHYPSSGYRNLLKPIPRM